MYLSAITYLLILFSQALVHDTVPALIANVRIKYKNSYHSLGIFISPRNPKARIAMQGTAPSHSALRCRIRKYQQNVYPIEPTTKKE